MSRRVLLICYYFPPMGLAGVGRPLALFRGLPQRGYDCHVLTVKPVTYWAYEPDLLSDSDTDRVFRSGSHDPQRIMHLLGIRKLKQSSADKTRKVTERFFPDSKIGWVRSAIRLGRTLVENYRYDALVSTSPPISAHLVAGRLADEFDVPWVADFRDYWTSNRIEEVYDKPSMLERGRRLLADIVSRASAVTSVSPAIAEYLGTGEVIANGYDERVQDWREAPDSDNYVIGFMGNLDEAESIRPLFEVVSRMRGVDERSFEKIRLLQVGNVDRAWLQSVLAEYELVDRCEILGYRPRKECLKTMSRSSMLYLGFSRAIEPEMVTSRIFELLASGRPLLAFASENSTLSGLIDRHGCGLHFTAEDYPKAVDYLRLHVTDFVNGATDIRPLPDFARQYSAEAIVDRFTATLDGLT
jgi:glycosyltransferase involved in cell wall biosynthesis